MTASSKSTPREPKPRESSGGKGELMLQQVGWGSWLTLLHPQAQCRLGSDKSLLYQDAAALAPRPTIGGAQDDW